jgi:glycosyltransferase involved in cell wall biosynthesis
MVHKKLPNRIYHSMNGTVPEYSIVVPAFNEELYLPQTLDNLHSAMMTVPMAGEIIVVDNNSTDRTSDVARRRGATVVFEAINQISRARNTGARSARGHYLIFVDADTRVSPELLQLALDRLKDKACAGGGAAVAPDKPLMPFYRLAIDVWNRFSIKFNIAAGCFIFCLKESFEAVGGFSQKVYVGEEVWLSIDIGRWARSRNLSFSIIDRVPAVTSMRKLSWFSNYHTLVLLVSMLFFPLIMRHRSLCRFWYRRPSNSTGKRVKLKKIPSASVQTGSR